MIDGGAKPSRPWEDVIALNNFETAAFELLSPATAYRDAHVPTFDWRGIPPETIDAALERDTFPLPTTRDREGYFGANHFTYWASGLRDRAILLDAAKRLGVELRTYLDLGCASGRVVRHFAVNSPEVAVYGCDINRRHVEWVERHLSRSILVFQNTSVPHLPIPDDRIDLVTCYSVFTHVEAFEMTWLMELRRILRPGGIAWITLNTDKTWEEMEPSWPIHRVLSRYPDFEPLKDASVPEDRRLIFRARTDTSYSSQVFYHLDYVRRAWGRIFEIVETHRRLPGFQDVVVLRKPA